MFDVISAKSTDDLVIHNAHLVCDMTRALRELDNDALHNRSARQACYIKNNLDDSVTFSLDRFAVIAEGYRRDLVARGILKHGND